ncbi:cysteine hydrolase family protein [Humibacillus xanthopallidus]|uniref:Nicotinamidase-related amidase n=1 Tax=Humibacillus xanthopallidus TaxID=412689 RepID=A0A543I2J2_9MICO|nr:cysteine hydrolase family protein [Humibacillus xanthopallidus]TQM64803.1 nicotinamidase-related amidase [Humibacillus xanthopallidus]
MTTLEGRPHTALIVVDAQQQVVADAWDRDGVLGRIAALVDKARNEQVPVIWVQHSDDNMAVGTDGWQLVPELSPAESEPLVHKRYGDSFEDTDLESVLAERGVGRLVVTGAQTDACIRSTLHGAFVRGYDTTLVADAHTTEDLRQWGVPVSPEQVIAHTNEYWTWSEAPGRTGDVKPAFEIDFGTG